MVRATVSQMKSQIHVLEQTRTVHLWHCLLMKCCKSDREEAQIEVEAALMARVASGLPLAKVPSMPFEPQ
jgi:hypothetical protein